MKAVNSLKTPELSPYFPNIVLLVMIEKEMFYNGNEINLFTAVVICAAAFCLLHCVPISPSLTFRLHCRISQHTVEQSITKHFVS